MGLYQIYSLFDFNPYLFYNPLMPEKGEGQPNPLSPEEIKSFAEEFHASIMSSAKKITKHGKHQQISDNQIVLGDDRNFINIMGLWTDKIHLVVGKTPIQRPGHSHFHLDLAHLLHLDHHEPELLEEEEQDPSAFDAWEAVVNIGEKPQIAYASHEWRTGVRVEEGKEKKTKVHVSTSRGIQFDNHEAVDGIRNLLRYV